MPADVKENERSQGNLHACTLPAFFRETVAQTKASRATKFLHWTKQALRGAWGANRGAQFHHGLIPITGSGGIEGAVGRLLQGLPAAALAQIPADRAQARQDAPDVSIQDSVWSVKRDAQDGGGGVSTDAGKSEDIFRGLRKDSAMLGDDLLRGSLQVARAAVVAEARPQAKDLVLGRGGESLNIREALEETVVVGNYRGHARLLKHDFREPNSVRVMVTAPGQVALEFAEPGQQLLSE